MALRVQKFDVGESVIIDGLVFLVDACHMDVNGLGETYRIYDLRDDLHQRTFTLPEMWVERLTERKTTTPEEGLQGRAQELAAEVREWLCTRCRTVYPGPPRPGFACVQCPVCQGDCGPRTVVELRNAQSRVVELERLLSNQGGVP